MKRSIPAYAMPAILEYLSARKAGGDEDAARLLARARRAKAPEKRLSLPGRTREERRSERNENMAAIRALVWEGRKTQRNTMGGVSLEVLEAAKVWAIRNGFPEALIIIRRKIEKVLRIRGQRVEVVVGEGKP